MNKVAGVLWHHRRGLIVAAAGGALLCWSEPATASPEDSQARAGDRNTVGQTTRATGKNIGRSVNRKLTRDRTGRRSDAEDAAPVTVAGTDGAQTFSGPFSIYVNTAYSNHDVKLRDLRSDQDLYTGLFGIDAFVHDKLLVGLTFGYSDLSETTLSNFGALFRTKTDADTISIAAYGAYILTDKFYIDTSFGYHSIDRRQFSTVAATGAPVFAARMDDDAYFLASNVNYVNNINGWTIGGQLGLQATRFSEGSFTNSIGGAITAADKRLDALVTMKVDVGYQFEMVRPYASVAYEFSPTPRQVSAGAAAASGLQVSDDRGNGRLALGIDVDVGPFTLSAEVQAIVLYEKHDEVGGFLNAKFNF